MYSQNFSQVSLIRKKEPRFPRQLKHRRVFQQIYGFRILKPHTLSKRKWKNPKARNKIHTTIMWVKSDTTFFLLFWEVSILNLPNPSETSTLKRIPFVQSTIDECLPPLLSSRIFHYKKRKRKMSADMMFMKVKLTRWYIHLHTFEWRIPKVPLANKK